MLAHASQSAKAATPSSENNERFTKLQKKLAQIEESMEEKDKELL